MAGDLTVGPIGPTPCPGSGTSPDVIEDLVGGERIYVCASCSAVMPSFELTPMHHPATSESAS